MNREKVSGMTSPQVLLCVLVLIVSSGCLQNSLYTYRKAPPVPHLVTKQGDTVLGKDLRIVRRAFKEDLVRVDSQQYLVSAVSYINTGGSDKLVLYKDVVLPQVVQNKLCVYGTETNASKSRRLYLQAGLRPYPVRLWSISHLSKWPDSVIYRADIPNLSMLVADNPAAARYALLAKNARRVKVVAGATGGGLMIVSAVSAMVGALANSNAALITAAATFIGGTISLLVVTPFASAGKNKHMLEAIDAYNGR